MPRISVDITPETEKYLIGQKLSKGSSISFEANILIEQSIKERNRKKNGRSKPEEGDGRTDN